MLTRCAGPRCRDLQSDAAPAATGAPGLERMRTSDMGSCGDAEDQIAAAGGVFPLLPGHVPACAMAHLKEDSMGFPAPSVAAPREADGLPRTDPILRIVGFPG